MCEIKTLYKRAKQIVELKIIISEFKNLLDKLNR